ncbi:MAG TPA: S41 family peptidase [Deinococcales bacterium]|nr:S41 family peptidase [Deinococcales bacterium]
MKRTYLVAAALVAVAAVGYAQLTGLGKPAPSSTFNTPAGKAFLETYQALTDNYLKPVSNDKLMVGALSGMLDSLNDPFTYYLTPDYKSQMDSTAQGSFFGVGATLNPANNDGTGAKVESTFKGSPAAKAGLQAGDVILKVDGKDVTKLTLTDAVKLIRGPKGSTVTLLVSRAGLPVTLKVIRDKITVASVSTELLPGKIGYVALADFLNETNVDRMKTALAGFEKQGVKGLVLDLRDNGGGYVDQAERIADLFLSKGDVFITRDRSKAVHVEFKASPSSTDYKGPLVVLANHYSASAAEIVTAALRDNGRAKVVGETTYGKGVANIPTPLANGGQVNVAFEEWLTPKRDSILKKGITPDYVVPDGRYPAALTVQGTGAPANAKVTVTVNGKPVSVKADQNGHFSYQAPAPVDPNSDTSSVKQGSANVDLKKDTQLVKALGLLGQ